MRKPDSFLLLDADFECVMREEVDDNDKDFKIIPYNNSSFFLKTEKSFMLWDHDSETSKEIDVEKCEPSLV